MYVVATAGHVDHGKSSLVRALTGMEPDRWAQEKVRGLTIDLGFAWCTLDSSREVGFVDVPGHERFVGNMLAGLGPAPVVLFVVASDEGWSAQSSEHRDAIAALGIDRGIVVLTKCDVAPSSGVAQKVRAELATTALADAPMIAVSATTGDGIPDLRRLLDDVLGELDEPETDQRVRLWVDRSFTISGAGTIVTGTLTAGTITTGESLEVWTTNGLKPVTVRGLHTHGRAVEVGKPVSRLAINLRGIAADDVARGDALLRPGSWPETDIVDVGRSSGNDLREAPRRLMVHVGTAAIAGEVRALSADTARLRLSRRLPVIVGDRLVLRDPGSSVIVAGVVVLDAEPPAFDRRGDAARRAAELRDGDISSEVRRRGAVRPEHLQRLGVIDDVTTPPHGIRQVQGWWILEDDFARWRRRASELVAERHRDDPMGSGISGSEVASDLGLPSPELLVDILDPGAVERSGAQLRPAGSADSLGAAEPAVAELVRQLRARVFWSPDAQELAAMSLGPRELAAAERAGRIVRLSAGVVLLPDGPALAMRELAKLDQPFTTSQARQAWDTTRRIAIPLLEYLDGRGWTRRIDANHREVRQSRST